MFKSIRLSDTGKRSLIASPQPKLAYDVSGPILSDGRPTFIVKSERTDFGLGKSSPVKQAFYDRFVIAKKHRATILQLAVTCSPELSSL